MRLLRAWESFWGYLGYLRRNRRQRKAIFARRRDLRRRHRMDTLEQRVVLNADAVDDSLTTDYQSPVVIAASQLTGNDSYSGTPTLSLPSSTAYGGSLADNYDGTYTYTPAGGFSGTDYFSYTLSDEDPSSDSATVSISVGSSPPQNNAPYANDDHYTVYAPYGSGGVTINWADYAPDLGNDSDPDGNPLSIFANNNPNGWQWIGSGQSAGYTYTVDDGQGGQATATVTVHVEEEAAPPVNNGPSAVDDYYTLTIPYGSSPYYADLSGYQPNLGNDSDPENDGLSITSNDNPGWTNVSAGSTVSFGYTITDGQGNYSSANVVISIVEDAPPTNNSPYADNAVFELRVPYGSGGGYYDLMGYIPQQGTHYDDPDGDGLTLTYGGYGWTYVAPGQQYSSSYSVDDGRGGFATATVFINIVEDYAPPSIPGGPYTINEDSTLSLPTTNPSGQPLSLSVLSGPTHGSLAIDAAGLIIYTPEANYFGTDSFSCSVSDGQRTSSPTTVTVEIQPIDDAPAATSDALTVPEDGSVSFTASDLLGNDSDPESGVTFVRVVQPPTNGTLSEWGSGSSTQFAYTPTANYCGGDSFVYEIVDGTGNLAQATVSINVTPVNDPPVAVGDDAGSMSEDGALVVWPSDWLGNDTDDEGVPTLQSVSASAGTLVANGNGSYTFTPPENFTGTTSLIYTIADSQGLTGSAAVTITVTPVNDAPTATGGAYSITEGSSLTLSSDDVDGDALLSAQVSLGPSYGNVTFADGTLTYTPSDPDFFGSDAFEYAVFDGQEWSSTVHVDVTVEPVNDAPAISAPTAQLLTTTGGTLVFSAAGGNALAVGDVEAGAKRLTLAVVHGQLSYGAGTPAQSLIISGTVAQLNAALEGLRFHAPANYAGPAVLTITVDDQDTTGGGPLTFTTTVVLRVQPTISIADAAASETAGGMTFTVTLSAACDQDVTVAWQTQADTADAADFTPASGTLTIAAGQTTGTITVSLTNDDRDEDDQTFQLQLSNPVNGVLADAVATGLIQDDEDAPLIYVVSREVREADGTVQVLVRLSHPSEKPIQVDWHPYDRSAIRGTDGNSYDWTQGSWTSPYSQQEFLDQGGYQDVWMESTGWYPVWIPDQYGDVWVDTSHYGDVLVPSGYWNYNVWVDTSHYGDVWVDTSHWGDVWVPNLINEPIWIDDQLDEYGNVVTAGYWQENWVDHGSNVYQLITEGHNEWQWITEGHYEDQWVDTSYYQNQWITEGHLENQVVIPAHTESQWTTVGWYQQQWVSNWQWTTVGYAGYWTDGGVLSFAPGVTEQAAEVTILDDSEAEGNENFTIQLSNAWNGALAPVSYGDVMIRANDHPLTVSTYTREVPLFAGDTWTSSIGELLEAWGAVDPDGEALSAALPFGSLTYGSLIDLGAGAFSYHAAAQGTEALNIVVTDADGFTQSVMLTFQIAPNAAPQLNPATVSPPAPILENVAAADNPGTLVSDLIAGAAPDVNDEVLGIAVHSVEALDGIWQYDLGQGAGWTDFPAGLTGGSALLLSADASTRVRFLPAADFYHVDGQADPTLTFRAWDRSNAVAGSLDGTLADASTYGGTSPYSNEFAIAAITVNGVSTNTAPELVPGSVVDLAPVMEDDFDNNGTLVVEVIAGAVTDTDNDPLGIAIIGTVSEHGQWNYSLGGNIWQPFPSTLGATSALLLKADGTTRIRFVPDSHYYTHVGDVLPSVTFRAWDRSNEILGSDLNGTVGDASSQGGSSPYSVDSVTKSVAIHLNADDDAFDVNEDQTLIRGALTGLLANDAGASNPNLSTVVVADQAPQHGLLELFADGSFEYTPDADYHGTDGFGYQLLNDGVVMSTASVVITIHAVNDAPTIYAPQAAALPVGGSFAFGSATSDAVVVADDEAGELEISGSVAHGGLTLASVAGLTHVEGGQGESSFTIRGTAAVVNAALYGLTYTPNVGYDGTDALSLQAKDSDDVTTTHSVALDVLPRLTMHDVQVNSESGSAVVVISLLSAATRPVTLDWALQNGSALSGQDFDTATVSGESALPAYSGSLTFAVGETTKTISVSLVNDGLREVDESFLLLVTNVAQAWFEGDPATVTIQDDDGNSTPIAASDAYSLDEDGLLVVDALNGVLTNDVDSDGDRLESTILTGPIHGEVTLTADGSFIYSPEFNFSGTDTFVYQVRDGVGGTDTATVTITVASQEDAPLAQNDVFHTASNATLSVLTSGVLSNDTDDESVTLTAALINAPSQGQLEFHADGTFVYVPRAGFSGADEFHYQVSDGARVAVGRVVIEVGDLFESAVLPISSNSFGIQGPTNFGLNATRDTIDGQSITHFQILSLPNGMLTSHSGAESLGVGSFVAMEDLKAQPGEPWGMRFTWYQDADEAPHDLVIRVQAVAARPDGNDTLIGDPIDVVIQVVDAPELTDDAGHPLGAQISVADGQDVTGIVVRPNPLHTHRVYTTGGNSVLGGYFSVMEDGSFFYQAPYEPLEGAELDTFTFQVFDDGALSDPITATVRVLESEDTPSSEPWPALYYEVNRGETLNVDASEGLLSRPTHADGLTDIIGYRITELAHGRLFAADGVTELTSGDDLTFEQSFAGLIFRPDANFVGMGSMKVVALTTTGVVGDEVALRFAMPGSGNANVVGAAPDAFTVDEDTALVVGNLGVVANDGLATNAAFVVDELGVARHGQVELAADGTFQYTPDENYFGYDSFTYQLTDDQGRTTTALVTIKVNAVNDRPTFEAGDDIIAAVDAGLVEIENWATLPTAGPDNESGQQLTFVVTTDNDGLFAADGMPEIVEGGKLRFTALQTGTAIVTVKLSDDGGPLANGDEASLTKTFKIEIVPAEVGGAGGGSSGGAGESESGEAVNNAPTVGAAIVLPPGVQYVRENKVLSLGAAVQVGENLPSDTIFQVKLKVTHGKLTPSDYKQDKSLTIVGKAASVNGTLDRLRYKPEKNYVGRDVLTIDVVAKLGSAVVSLPAMIASLAIEVLEPKKEDPNEYRFTSVSIDYDPAWEGKEGAKGKIVGQLEHYINNESDAGRDRFKNLDLELSLQGQKHAVAIDGDGKFEYAFQYEDDDPSGTNGDHLPFELKLKGDAVRPHASDSPEEDKPDEMPPEPPQVGGSIDLKNYAPYLESGAEVLNDWPAYYSHMVGAEVQTWVEADVSSYYRTGGPRMEWVPALFHSDVEPFLAKIAAALHFKDPGPDSITVHNITNDIDQRGGIFSEDFYAIDDDGAFSDKVTLLYQIIPDSSRLEDYLRYQYSDVELGAQVDSADDYQLVEGALQGAGVGTVAVNDDGSPNDPINLTDGLTATAVVSHTNTTTYEVLYHRYSNTYPKEASQTTFGNNPAEEGEQAGTITHDVANVTPQITFRAKAGGDPQYANNFSISPDGAVTYQQTPGSDGNLQSDSFAYDIFLKYTTPGGVLEVFAGTRGVNIAGKYGPGSVHLGVTTDVIDGVAIEAIRAADGLEPPSGSDLPLFKDADQAVVKFARNVQVPSSPPAGFANGIAPTDVDNPWETYFTQAARDKGEQELTIKFRLVQDGEDSEDLKKEGSEEGEEFTTTIAAGENYVLVDLKAIDDDVRERDERVKIVIVSVNGKTIDDACMINEDVDAEEGEEGKIVGEILVVDNDQASSFGSNNVDTGSTGAMRETVLVDGRQIDLFDGRASWQAPFSEDVIATYQYGYAGRTYVTYLAAPESGSGGAAPLAEAADDSWLVEQNDDHGTLIRPWLGAGDVSTHNPNPQVAGMEGFFGYVDVLTPVARYQRAIAVSDSEVYRDGDTWNGFLLLRRDGTSAWFEASPSGTKYSPVERIDVNEQAKTKTYTYEFTGLTAGRYYFVSADASVDPADQGLYQADAQNKITFTWTTSTEAIGPAATPPKYELYQDLQLKSPSGTLATFKTTGDTNARYVLEYLDGTSYSFDDNGLLREESDRHQNQTEYTYDRGADGKQDARLSEIKLQGGGKIRFDYTVGPRTNNVEVITDSTNRQIRIADGEIFSPLPQNDGVNGSSSQMRAKIGGELFRPDVSAKELAQLKPGQVTAFLDDLSYVSGEQSHDRKAPTGTIGKLAPANQPDADREAVARYRAEYYVGTSAPAAWTFQFDRFGLLTAKAAPKISSDSTPKNDVWIWQRNALTGQVEYYKAPAGRGYVASPSDGFDVTSYGYYADGNVEYITYEDNTYEYFTYDANRKHQLSTYQDRNGNVTKYELEFDGDVRAVIDPLKNRTSMRYTANPADINAVAGGMLLTVTQPSGDTTKPQTTTRYEYYESGSAKGLVHYVYRADGTTSETKEEYTYNRDLLLDTFIDAEGVRHRYVYDRIGQLMEEYVGKADGELLVAKYGYDAAGNRTSETTPASKVAGTDVRTTRYEYDAWNRLQVVTTPSADNVGGAGPGRSYFDYTADGRLEYSYDAANRLTTYHYDERGRLEELEQSVDGLVDAGGDVLSGEKTTTVYTYDSVGNLRSETSSLTGATTNYTYDSNGRLVRKELPDPDGTSGANGANLPALIVTYSYDNEGNQTAATLPRPEAAVASAPTAHNFYDAAGRLIRSEGPPVKASIGGAPQLSATFTAYEYYGDGSIKAVYEGFAKSPSDAAPLTSGLRKDDITRLTTTTEYDPLGRVKKTTVIDKTSAASQDSASTTSIEYFDKSDNPSLPVNDVEAVRYEKITAPPAAGLDRVTWNYYDQYGRLIRTISPDPDGTGVLPVVSNIYLYNKDGSLAEQWRQAGTTGPKLQHVEFQYDEKGRLTDKLLVVSESPKATESLGSYEYDLADRVVNETTASGAKYVYGYDAFGNITSKEYRDASTGSLLGGLVTEQFRYDAHGNLRSHVDPYGDATGYEYDALDRKRFSREFDFSYVSDSDANHYGTKQTEFVYTPNGELDYVLSPGPGTWNSNVDTLGRAGRVAVGSASLLKNTYYKYDPAGNVIELQDADGNITKYEYDGFNRVRKETITLNGAAVERTWSYDGAGNLIRYKDRDGRITDYAYDALGRRTDETSSGYHAEYKYWEDGNLKSAEDANSKYEYSGYDPQGRAGQVKQTIRAGTYASLTTTFDYTYDDQLTAANRKTSSARTEYTVKATVGTDEYYTNTYQFDAVGREVWAGQNTTTASDKQVVHSYYSNIPAGLIDSNDRAPYADRYDSVTYYQLGQQAGPRSDIVLKAETFFEKQDGGLIRRINVSTPLTDSLLGFSLTYNYDDRNLLRRSVERGQVTTLQYDVLGQIDANKDGRSDFTANGNTSNNSYGYNRTKKINDWSLSYYKEGTVETAFDARPTASTLLTYSWDNRNRLTRQATEEKSIDGDSGYPDTDYEDVDFYYDVFNNLVGKRIARNTADSTQTGDVELFVFDGGQRTLSFKFESGTTTPVLQSRNFYSTSGQIYAVDAQPVVNGAAEGFSTHWLAVNREGNVVGSYRFGFDALGVVAAYSYAEFKYSAWGGPSVEQPGGHESLFGVDPNLLGRFQGGIYDADVQAYKFGDRWLSTSLNRWLSEDPSGLLYGTNPYEALGNSPYNFRDPTGHIAFIPFILAGAAALTAGVAAAPTTNLSDRAAIQFAQNSQTDAAIAWGTAAVTGGLAMASIRAAGGAYLLKTTATASLGTGSEYAMARAMGDRSFSVGGSFAKNFATDFAIGWLPGMSESRLLKTIATRYAAHYTREVALSTATDTAWGVAVEGRNGWDVFTQSLVGNMISQPFGDAFSGVLRGLGYVSRARLCFAAGTLVELQEAFGDNSDGDRDREAIDQLDLGRRVRGTNPLGKSSNSEEPDASWKRIVLKPLGDGADTQIELLRSMSWLTTNGAESGKTIDLDIPELHVSGLAHVLSICDGPTIMPGNGQVVTGLFRHTAQELLEVYVSGLAEPIVGTPKHPYWSATRRMFIAADALCIGEVLVTSDGRAVRVSNLVFRSQPTSVYNIEVQGDHVYHVSSLGLLVHNASENSVVAPSDAGWRVRRHGDMPIPRPAGFQSHHGVNSVWFEANLPGYRAVDAPGVLMPNAPNHNATRGVFNRIRAEIASRQRVSPRDIDWTAVSPGTAWRIAEEQFAVAQTPSHIREEYFRQLNEYLDSLK